MSILGYLIVQFTAWALVALPIVALIARFLPGEATIGGPWKGLKVGLRGAFAGYVIVLIVGFFFIIQADWNADEFKLVEARGSIRLQDAEELYLPAHQVTIAFEPATRIIGDEDAMTYNYVVRMPARHLGAEVYKPMVVDAVIVNAQDHFSRSFFVNEMVVPTAGSYATLPEVELRKRRAVESATAASDGIETAIEESQ